MKSAATTAIVTRSARPDDAAAVAAIYNEAIRTTTATFDTEEKTIENRRAWLEARSSRHVVLLAESGGAVAGFASLSPWSDRRAYADTAENSVYVNADSRAKGIGRALMQALLEAARTHGFHTIIARVADGNPASARLHEALGFARIGTMRQVGRKFGRLIDMHIYQYMVK